MTVYWYYYLWQYWAPSPGCCQPSLAGGIPPLPICQSPRLTRPDPTRKKVPTAIQQGIIAILHGSIYSSIICIYIYVLCIFVMDVCMYVCMYVWHCMHAYIIHNVYWCAKHCHRPLKNNYQTMDYVFGSMVAWCCGIWIPNPQWWGDTDCILQPKGVPLGSRVPVWYPRALFW